LITPAPVPVAPIRAVSAVLDVLGRHAQEVREKPLGSVGVLHSGPELKA